MLKKMPVPVTDLFAGPGGLGEGFSSYCRESAPVFRIALSIEKEEYAHRALLLRSFYRQFQKGEVPQDYYKYLRGEISRTEPFERHPKQNKGARQQCQRIEITGQH